MSLKFTDSTEKFSSGTDVQDDTGTVFILQRTKPIHYTLSKMILFLSSSLSTLIQDGPPGSSPCPASSQDHQPGMLTSEPGHLIEEKNKFKRERASQINWPWWSITIEVRAFKPKSICLTPNFTISSMTGKSHKPNEPPFACLWNGHKSTE